MTLKDCTKEELIFVIRQLQFYGLTAGDSYIRYALRDVERQREEQKLEKARQLSEYAKQKHTEYMELIGPYVGLPLSDIPDDVIKKASAAQEECERANLKWFKLMGIKIKQ